MVETTLIGIGRRATDHYATATEKNSFHGDYDADSVIVTLAIALALYNSIEMILLIATTFKKYSGLYFWSLSLCNYGVILFAIGMMLGYFDLCILWLSKVILDIGWVAMVTCQSLVLYSRLGLILGNVKILNAVKWMIVFNSFTLCTLVVLLDFGNTYSKTAAFYEGYYYIEQIQMIMLTLQELIISGLYVWKTLALLKVISKENTRSMIWQLFVINVIIITMDIALVTLQFLHFQLYQESIKVFVYSVKLKLELNILSKVVDLVNSNQARRSMTLDFIDGDAIQGQAQREIRRELNASDNAVEMIAPDEKPHRDIVDDQSSSKRRSSSTASPKDDGLDVYRVTSTPSRYSNRTSGRETDIVYAEFLRSMK